MKKITAQKKNFWLLEDDDVVPSMKEYNQICFVSRYECIKRDYSALILLPLCQIRGLSLEKTKNMYNSFKAILLPID